ncbi:MAG: putative metal-binding motif-containing protein [Archangiaceae bacterium]|nr:putative metal-binding motif-containing protein [Archangiaceae bacterium]
MRRALALLVFVCGCTISTDPSKAPGDPSQVAHTEQALGEPTGGYPSDQERMVHVLLNLARHSGQTPNMNECGPMDVGAIKKPPFVYSREANVGARFTSRHMSELGCYQHDSCCVLGDAGVGIGCVAPGQCSGAMCQKTCDAGVGQDSSSRYALFGFSTFSGESIAQQVMGGYDFWCGVMNSPSNYSAVIDDAGTQVGIGNFTAAGAMCNGSYWTIAYGNAQVQIPKVPVGAALYSPPNPLNTSHLQFMASYYDPSGKAPQRSAVVVNGHCFDLDRTYGYDDNGTYVASFPDPDVLPDGCHPYYFLFQDGDGQRTTYPTTGSFQLPLGSGHTCPVAYDSTSQLPADCETGVQQCPMGATQSCFTADPSTLGKGECRQGYQVCKNGFWSACRDMIGPFPEICDGLDNDCDGTTDENNPGGAASCAVPGEVGECVPGTKVCTSGRLQCLSVNGPAPEVCDGKDNDCDGTADDGFNLITCGVGECFRMVDSCINGVAQTCDGGSGTAEVEDGKDNDCNGQVDEGFPCTGPRTIYPSSKVLADGGTFVLRPPCRNGTQQCNPDGGWGQVLGAIIPKPEECNGVDDDCDGFFDNQAETLNRIGRSRCGVGACTVSVYDCRSNTLLGCDAGAPAAEVCDGLDNNCDGTVDESCSCRIGEERGCYTGPQVTRDAGVCHGGKRSCVDGGYTRCTGEVKPSAELCNGLDDDCDGTVDEMCLQVDGGSGGGAGGGGGSSGTGGGGTGGAGGSTEPKGCGCTGTGVEALAALALLALRRRSGPGLRASGTRRTPRATTPRA